MGSIGIGPREHAVLIDWSSMLFSNGHRASIILSVIDRGVVRLWKSFGAVALRSDVKSIAR
jgi:hypothetical protein